MAAAAASSGGGGGGSNMLLSADGEEDLEENPGALSIFYHLFEDPVWFDGRDMGGLKAASQIVNWVINILIFVSTYAFCMETSRDMSGDCDYNPDIQVVEVDGVSVATPWSHRTCTEWSVIWTSIEVTCVVCFTADFFIRLIGSTAAGKAGQFVVDKLNWIDLIAIVPFYVKLMPGVNEDVATWLGRTRFIRVIRLVRVLRSMPGAKHGNLADIIVNIVVQSKSALFVPVYFMSLAIVVFASVTYYVELPVQTNCVLDEGVPLPETVTVDGDGRHVIEAWSPAIDLMWEGYDGNAGCLSNVRPGPTADKDLYMCQCPGTVEYVFSDGSVQSDIVFESIPNAMWWCVVTFTTVGYGDISPQTVFGKIVGTLTMICGVFFMAMPLAIVGDAFITTWNKLQAKKEKYWRMEKTRLYDDNFTTPGTWVPQAEHVVAANDIVQLHMSRIGDVLRKLAAERREDDKRHRLEELAEGQLRSRASSAGAEESQLEQAGSAEDPKEEYMDLIILLEDDEGDPNEWSEAMDTVTTGLPEAWDAIHKSLRDLDAKD